VDEHGAMRQLRHFRGSNACFVLKTRRASLLRIAAAKQDPLIRAAVLTRSGAIGSVMWPKLVIAELMTHIIFSDKYIKKKYQQLLLFL